MNLARPARPARPALTASAARPLRPPARAVAAALLLSLVAVGLTSGPPPALAATPSDTTSAQERGRVDAVPTPVLGWYDCGGGFRCTTVSLPRDYDRPSGPRVEIALMKLPARTPKARIGTLFLNPGGPGSSGVQLVQDAPSFLSRQVRDRFDVVGFDPRGVGYSDALRCFPTPAAQAPVLRPLTEMPFPYGAKAEKSYLRAERRLGQACSSTGKPLSVSMSTAEVARDLDVLRRAVGDERLTYLGFSYGSYLGQVYANLFPDRVRALALDGVLDPVGWAGTPATAKLPIEARIHSAEGASKALRTLLVRCDRAGVDRCSFAAGNPVRRFDTIATRLKRHPVVATDPFTGDATAFGYPELVANVLSALYFTDAGDYVTSLMSQLASKTTPAARNSVTAPVPGTAQGRSSVRLGRLVHAIAERGGRPGLGFPYENGFETQAAVACTDSLNPARLSSYPKAAAAADRRAKYFGRFWTWSMGACARDSFPGRDEDAYRGPFTRRTAAPLLFVASYWDPATSYAGAKRAAALAPGSVLLASDSWGHTSYDTSRCVTAAVDTYLLQVRTPAAGTVCVGDDQPFAGDDAEAAPAQRALAGAKR